jgi:hypothetical protein
MTLPSDPRAQEQLGVLEALGRAWSLLTSDFWPLWVVGLVAFLLMQAVNLPGAVPYIGGCFSLLAGIFLQPPLQAGLVYAVARRIDGGPADVANLFQGFQQRYWASVVASLPLWGVGLGLGLAILLAAVAIFGTSFAIGGGQPNETVLIVGAVGLGLVALVLVLLVIAVVIFFSFSFVALWEPHATGWQAVLASARIVRAHLLATLGLALIAMAITLGAALAGLLTCCVGVLLTVPAAMVWLNATLVYLYRAWRSA